jgi:tRNA pseudouridine55 synthase
MEKVMLHGPTGSPDRTLSLPTSAPPLAVSGVMVLDKPEERTSFSVVAEIKKLLRLRKVGHCGTLDPFATGVFVLCLNRATRIADQLLEQDKVYRCLLRFGSESDTQDRTGKVLPVYDGPPLPEAMVRQALDRFRGAYDQQVPRYSAVKVQGRRLYKLSRKGIVIDLPRRGVRIHTIRLLAFAWPEAEVEVHCSKGTYIRQLAADIGRDLQCGAYLRELRRVASGPFTLDQAMSLEEFRNSIQANRWQEKVIRTNDALAHLPAISIAPEETVRRLQEGYLDAALEIDLQEQFSAHTTPVRLVAEWNNELIALWWPHENGQKHRRLRVFGADDTENTPPSQDSNDSVVRACQPAPGARDNTQPS